MKYQRRMVRIGNSHGVVLTKTLLKLAEIEEAFYFDVELEKGKIILTPALKASKK